SLAPTTKCGPDPGASLKASKQQLFKSHPSHLPKGALFAIHFQPALALVTEGRAHLKHGISFLIPHYNRVLGEGEYYRPVHIFGFHKGAKGTAIVGQRKFVRGVIGAQGVASLKVLVNLQSECLEYPRQRASGTLRYPVELRRILLHFFGHANSTTSRYWTLDRRR